ncbi:phosphopantothenoylcysteine decarboxylase-like protein [Tanacetum coccineum]|uniref:Phosphopantothenoylcysteine decarboxylase-like protein n=1 Tax=Tanacetum coccineum TaxID=301880 RepID=A0ABQ5I899_9ASTR
MQQVQGRQGQNYSGTTYKGNATSSRGNTTSGQARIIKCYSCQGEGHMARQCTQPKQPRNAAWYKEKAMLAEAQEAGQILDEEQLAFLADLGILADQAQTVIPHNAAFQTEDLDTYDSDCDDLSTAQTVLMANISNYGSDIISELATVQDTNLQHFKDSTILSVIEKLCKYEESHVRIKCGSISKKKKSNYSCFQAIRSSCNEDMVKYEDQWPCTTRTSALNERFNKKISPARTQPPGWSVNRLTESLPPDRRFCRRILKLTFFISL